MINLIVESLIQRAVKTIDINKECFIAQWIIQNPDENINDWCLCYLSAHGNEGVKVWMERKRETKI